jgi:hypothetical protein
LRYFFVFEEIEAEIAFLYLFLDFELQVSKPPLLGSPPGAKLDTYPHFWQLSV